MSPSATLAAALPDMRQLVFSLLCACGASVAALAQEATVRGNVLDADTGEPVAFATVQVVGAPAVGTTTDVEGFFALAGLEPGVVVPRRPSSATTPPARS